jgi:hypothetical protein
MGFLKKIERPNFNHSKHLFTWAKKLSLGYAVQGYFRAYPY